MDAKQCPRCGEVKLLTAFARDKTAPSGWTSHCKMCRNKARSAYRSNPENIQRERAYNRQWKATHREKVREHKRQFHQRHADRLRAEWREKYARNPEPKRAKVRLYRAMYPDRVKQTNQKVWVKKMSRPEYREYHRVRTRRWRAEHPDYRRDYYQRNKLKFLVWFHRRRARKAQNGGNFTVEEWQALCEQYGNKCLACGAADKLTVDHITPISLGGTNDISNIQPLCGRCNSSKGARSIDYRPKT